MNRLKHELQNIIRGNEQAFPSGLIKTTQLFLKGNESAGFEPKRKQHLKSEEETSLLKFIADYHLFYDQQLNENDFIAEGAEQKVFRFDDNNVVKLNDAVFYASWADYFNNLLIHNRLFPTTAYQLLGFKLQDDTLFAVVKQPFIGSRSIIDLDTVREFLEFNGFKRTRNNDYYNEVLGLILEDLHDENVISNNGLLYFIDTIFFLTKDFFLEG